MKKQFIFILTLLVVGFGCNQGENEVTLDSQEAELLNVLSAESTAMFDASFTDLNELFSSSSVTELESFNADEFSRNSVLDYAKGSAFLSPHYEAIEAVVGSNSLSHAARTTSENVFTEEEQQYVDVLTEAFSLLPDRDAFEKEIGRVESEITSSISDEESRLKLLVIATSSVASVNYLFDNEDKIMEQMQTHSERLTHEYGPISISGRIACDPPNSPECQGGGSGGGSSCCFKGDFEWDWTNFGSGVVGGATGGATWAVFANVVPGVGSVAYGSAIVGGAITAAAAYAGYQFTQWAFSEPTTGGGGASCSRLFGDPCNAQ